MTYACELHFTRFAVKMTYELGALGSNHAERGGRISLTGPMGPNKRSF